MRWLSLAVAMALLTSTHADAAPYIYGYDDADNLTTATGTAMSWSGASYNNVNQPGTLGSNSYSYDANGNLISDGVRSYKWDAEDRLISIDHPGNLHTTFSYDGHGRRIAITTTNGTTTRYLWSGNRLVQARDASNNVTRRYYAEGEVVVASNTRLAYAIDRVGSVRDVLNVADGSRTFAADYEPYGAVSQSSGAIPTDFRYAGLFTLTDDSQTLYLANSRAYDPGASRWLNRDPIREGGGINMYAYTANDPTNASDPMGLESWGEWASSWIETADINFRVFRDEMFNSGFGAGVVLPEGLKLLRSAAGYVYGGCGCKERELPPIAGGAPAIPPQFPPGPKSLLTNDEAAKLWDYVQNLETVVQGTTKSELAKATDTGPFLGAGYCVDYFRKLAPELPPNASPFELVAQALNNYASKGAGSNLLKGPVPNIWTFLGRAPPVP